jgi:hypothetical protein
LLFLTPIQKMSSAFFDYVATLTENLDSLDQARRVSTCAIFDTTEDAVRQTALVLSEAIDQIPNNIYDIKVALNLDAKLSKEIALWVLPRLEPLLGTNITINVIDFIQEVKDDVVAVLNKFPFVNDTVIEPITNQPRYVGLVDFVPPIFSARQIPPLLRDLGLVITETLRFFADEIHTGNFSDWNFDPALLQRLMQTQLAFAVSLGDAAVGPICTAHDLLSGIDVFGGGGPTDDSNCTWRIHWAAVDFTMCPLELIPCPKDELAQVVLAMEHVLDALPQLILFPRNFSSELFNRSLCDLQTATHDLQVSFAAWEISATIPYWGTDLELDVPTVISSAAFTGVKWLALVNKLLVEALKSFIPKHHATQYNPYSATYCDRDTPTYYANGCYACLAVSELIDRCPEGYFCCGDGTCADFCFDGPGIVAAINDAGGSLINFGKVRIL